MGVETLLSQENHLKWGVGGGGGGGGGGGCGSIIICRGENKNFLGHNMHLL